MNNAIAIVLLVIFIVIILFLLKAKLSTVSGKLSKLPIVTYLIILVSAIAVVVVLVKYLLDNTTVHGNPGNVDAIVAEEGNALEEEEPVEEVENTITLSGDQIWIDGKKVDFNEAESYIEGFSGTENELIVVDDYSTAYLHHRITEVCQLKNVIPKCIEKDENE